MPAISGRPSCINCYSPNADTYRDDDDHIRKRCEDCGYDWGPFTSGVSGASRTVETEPSGQVTLGAF